MRTEEEEETETQDEEEEGEMETQDEAFVELSKKVILLSENFQRKSACFRRAWNGTGDSFDFLYVV